ncbi:gamma-mobile-trio protein GmtX [Pseudomonas akapageensis]|uniref:gamma-mobile-trio protein GmtX n=1 Tax=Pseudomonas akapageensis TaxID=2609961 RepID=UPI0014091D0C|nr:gamma-mobile-trio protein GmtX [Pseudomonas akapageensis]
MIDAQAIFEDLKSQASTRQAKSLSALNDVLKVQHAAGERNFSIAEIARLSAQKGGPSAQTIRNKTGLVFRQLIEAWAAQAGASMKAPINPQAKGNRVPKDYELLERLSDPAMRAIFGQIIAERNRFRNELNTLKANSELIVDRRPVQHVEPPIQSGVVQLVHTLNLNDMEVEALKAAISDEFFERREWIVSAAGQVKDENKREIYKHGYVNAIKKVLKEV